MSCSQQLHDIGYHPYGIARLLVTPGPSYTVQFVTSEDKKGGDCPPPTTFTDKYIKSHNYLAGTQHF